tara:strand:- start:1677 stop:2429 length:753 start_codon:yes stop_codon:yes gene_type:complete
MPIISSGAAIGGAEIVKNNLIHYFDFSNESCYVGGTSTAVRDLSGRNYGGTAVGFAGTTSSGFNPGARFVTFDGDNDRIEIGNISAYDFDYDASFSVGVWFRLTEDTGGTLISKTYTGAPYKGWYLHFNATNDDMNFALINNNSPSRRWRIDSNATMAQETWYYVVGTHSYSSGHIGTLYVNTVEGHNVVYDSLGTYATTTTKDVSIGARDSAGSFSHADIAITQIYNRVLTASEVKYNYYCDAARFGLS